MIRSVSENPQLDSRVGIRRLWDSGFRFDAAATPTLIRTKWRLNRLKLHILGLGSTNDMRNGRHSTVCLEFKAITNKDTQHGSTVRYMHSGV